jgi:hypothetical protein
VSPDNTLTWAMESSLFWSVCPQKSLLTCMQENPEEQWDHYLAIHDVSLDIMWSLD